MSLLVLVLLALVAAACGGKGNKSSSGPSGSTGKGAKKDFNQAQFEGQPRTGGNITFGVESNFASLDPAGNLAQPSDIVTALAIYDPLVTYDAAGKIAPSLATKWSNTDDLKTYRLTLRTDVKFGDGTPFNADAVVQHFTRLKDPATNCTCAEVVAKIAKITATSPSQVEFTLTEPNAFFMNILAATLGMIVSPAQVAKFGANYARNPMGTGPFVLESYSSQVLKKNPNYWKKDSQGRRLPYLDQITMKSISDAQVRLQSLKAGDIDIMQTADTSNIVDALQDKQNNFKVQKVTGSSSTITLFNLKKPPFNDLRVRQAFAYATNRDRMNQVQYNSARQPSYLPFATDSPFYDKNAKVIKFDRARAKSLLSAAIKDGVNPSFKYTCIPTDEARRVTAALRPDYEAAGFKVTNEFQDQGAYVNRIFSKGGDYQAGCFRNAQCASADCLYSSLRTNEPGNVVFYSNAKVDRALEAVRQTTNVNEQIKQLKIVQEQIAKDIPALPLLYDLFGNIYQPQLSGLPVPEPWSLGAIKVATLYLKK
ncbi:MAG: hypothetical protein HYX34_10360 [Actinobacteria bacterium]|nr:hypothetical protein [Actinomycetota bacterium]